MKYFIDTEFSERGPKHPIELISVGLVDEHGREFYAVNSLFNPEHANPWVAKNVLPLLPPIESGYWGRRAVIGRELLDFIGNDPAPEFWGYYSDYDWVVVCQLFGDMSQLPNGWPYYCRDLRQALDERGLQHVHQPDDAPHDALQDARWIAETYRSLAAAPPDDAVTRVLEAADGIRDYIGMLLVSSMSDHDKQKVMTVVAKYDAAVSALRSREGR